MKNRNKIRVTVHSILGTCNQAHKVGQEFIIDRWTQKGICLTAFGSLYPAIRVLQYGGSFPWDKDPNVTYIPCPDAKNQVVFRIERLHQEA
jgi:uncharacterized repeat protein (TIGR04076 family)